MKTRFVISLLALMCSQAWAAETPPDAPQTGWQQAVDLAGMQPQKPSTAMPPAPPAAQPAAQSQPSAPATGQATPVDGDDPLPPPSPVYQAAQAQVAPLSPGEVRELRGQHDQVNRALKSPTMTIVPRISAQTSTCRRAPACRWSGRR
jgi:intracellular multiplication protein IcmK